LAAGLQIAASIPNFLCQEQVSLGDGYIKNPFNVRDGFVDLPAAPGLGIELDDNAMADKIGHDWRNAETYDPDDGRLPIGRLTPKKHKKGSGSPIARQTVAVARPHRWATRQSPPPR